MKSRLNYPVFPLLENKSKFFCPAKWTELYLYLNHGTSNSCHHPIPHAIPENLLDDPYVLHNTPHKLKMQQLMINGHRPEECHMCWHIEDIDPDVVTDRIVKSTQWENDIKSLKVDPHHVPRFIEVVFDNYCNLSCSYCDSGQSSSWAEKIHRQPLTLETDYRNLYNIIHIAPGSTKDRYVDAWNQWWAKIGPQVDRLKISGGEPLLSKNVWKFFETLSHDLNSLVINSNFSVASKTVERFIEVTEPFKNVSVAASIDAVGDIAEYARQGLDYNQFLSNIDLWCSSSKPTNVLHLQSTVNALNVWGLTDKFDLNIELSHRYPGRINPFYSTLVRFPEFQSVTVLPDSLRQGLAGHISKWLANNRRWLSEREQSYVEKIIVYLQRESEQLVKLDADKLALDFKKFIMYYNASAKKNYNEIYPQEFVEWIDSINI
jgi:organic radical activating enzyme